jgi:hypothetical protein
MKKNLFIIVLIISTFLSTALAQTESSPEIEVLAKIQTTGHAIKLIRLSERDVIPSLLKNKELEKVISQMRPDEDALVKGHITYQATTIEGQAKLEPIFIIESIHPVSLKLLGKIKPPDDNELANNIFRSPDKKYAPFSIPVTTEVASALTLTTSVLLLQSLTASANQPQVEQQLNTGLFLFAGALATGVFIYDQIKSNHSKGKNHD